METFLIRALQLIMSLSLLVIVHEGGHFLFARLFDGRKRILVTARKRFRRTARNGRQSRKSD